MAIGTAPSKLIHVRLQQALRPPCHPAAGRQLNLRGTKGRYIGFKRVLDADKQGAPD
jgi:hypothetical protein